jgi:hypothetical protein
MAKQPQKAEPKKTDTIPVRLRPIIRAYLRELVATGTYGKSSAEVMRRFIENGIRRALEARVIVPKNIADFGEKLEEADPEGEA